MRLALPDRRRPEDLRVDPGFMVCLVALHPIVKGRHRLNEARDAWAHLVGWLPSDRPHERLEDLAIMRSGADAVAEPAGKGAHRAAPDRRENRIEDD